MKTKINKKRLVLNKITLANLENSEMVNAKGGYVNPMSMTLFYTNCVECHQYSNEIPCYTAKESRFIPCDQTEGPECQ